jgi:hypothetical protein
MTQDTFDNPPLTTTPAEVVFDNQAKKGWEFFTKFLFGNVVLTILALVFVGILTVWS